MIKISVRSFVFGIIILCSIRYTMPQAHDMNREIAEDDIHIQAKKPVHKKVKIVTHEICTICSKNNVEADESALRIEEFIHLNCGHSAHKSCLKDLYSSKNHFKTQFNPYYKSTNHTALCQDFPAFDDVIFICNDCKKKLNQQDMQEIGMDTCLCKLRCYHHMMKNKYCYFVAWIMGGTIGLSTFGTWLIHHYSL